MVDFRNVIRNRNGMGRAVDMETEGKEEKVVEKEVAEKKEHEPVMDAPATGKGTNLCCCYAVDPCGCYYNPCFTPVTSCCC
jgi:hypothetical protein